LAIGFEADQYAKPGLYVALQRRNTARMFRAATRHSRRVRRLRVFIPAIAGILSTILVLFTWFDPLRMFATLPVGLGDLVISGTKIKMEEPRLSGYTRDGRPYDLTARTAAQDITKPNQIELNGLHAKMRLQDKSTVDLTAENGLFNSKSEVLHLDNDIRVSSTSGLRGRLSEAMVDTQTGHLVSDKPVTFTTDKASIKANSMEVQNSGEAIWFKGGVSVDLFQPLLPSQSGEKAAPQ
jgi:lipopolysaccharide export system protein LptC